jgi:hypothetical protein
MTSDEIREEFEAWASLRWPQRIEDWKKNKMCAWEACVQEAFEKAYLAAAEPREKRIAELESQTCHHGWRGTSPDAPSITTPCPTCGSRSLFIGSGGHLTCSRVPGRDNSGGCSEPGVEHAVDKLKARIAELEQERDRAVEVADATTKGVYSKYMLEAAAAIGRDLSQGLKINGLKARLARVTEALGGLVQLVSVAAYDVLPAEAAMFITNDGKFNAARAALTDEQEQRL